MTQHRLFQPYNYVENSSYNQQLCGTADLLLVPKPREDAKTATFIDKSLYQLLTSQCSCIMIFNFSRTVDLLFNFAHFGRHGTCNFY